MKKWLQGQWVILSGASSGIGKEICKILVRCYGANVFGIGRREEKMLALQSELGENADRFDYALFDVGSRDEWQNLAEKLSARNIAPILLINNAGVFPTFEKVLNTNSETFEKVLQTNYLSVVYAVEAIAPLVLANQSHKPAIVNVASSAALCTVVGTAAYSASKAAVKAYTESLAFEEKGKIHVGIIYPGTTATELFRADENTKNSALDLIAMPAEKMAKKIARKIYKKRKRAVVGWDAKLMNFTAKLMPVKGLSLICGVMKASKSKVFTNVFDYEKKK